MPGGADTMRQLEREIMLQLIDQRWREHLSEMDYLREGINLRAMGQQDPLVAWQKEGYDMFGQMVSSIDDDYVKIAMHAQVQVLEAAEDLPEVPDMDRAQYQAADDPVQGSGAVQRALARGPVEDEDPGEPVMDDEEPTMQPIVKSELEKTGRNDPCPCGSGKKYKLCHGR
jgi:preprotein translocase subunit SecA